MGEIWLAEDPLIGRSVAVKRMLGERPDQVHRFEVEAQVTGQLEHPGIVPIHELGISDDGQPFYVMKFVNGRTLQKVIEEYHQADQAKAAARGRAVPPAPDFPVAVPDGGLCPQPGRPAPRPEARKRHARPLWRDASARLGNRQGHGSTGRRRRPTSRSLVRRPAESRSRTPRPRRARSWARPSYMAPEVASGPERPGRSSGATSTCWGRPSTRC